MLPVRSRLARRAVSSRLFRGTRAFARARIAGTAAVCSDQARGTSMKAVVVTAIVLASAAAIVFAQQPQLGVPLDPALFAFQRTIPDGRPGAVALIVDPLTLAHSRGPGEHFADVRILDGSRRQVPYVIEHRDDPMIEPLT